MTLIAGFGYRAAATADSLADALARARAAAGTDAPITAYCVPADKAGQACAAGFAAAAGVTVTPVAVAAMEEVETPTQSEKVLDKRGVGSVAEAVALAAAGPGGRVIVARVVSADHMATCALVEG